jgi:hypothetical protein
MACNPNDHKFVFRGFHVEGKEISDTSVPYKTLYEVYFCEKCLKTERKHVTAGTSIDIPPGASKSGYGFSR